LRAKDLGIIDTIVLGKVKWIYVKGPIDVLAFPEEYSVNFKMLKDLIDYERNIKRYFGNIEATLRALLTKGTLIKIKTKTR